MATKAHSADDNVRKLPRRSFVKAATYVAPAILTLKAVPAYASYGSGPVQSSTSQPGGKAIGKNKNKDKNKDKNKNSRNAKGGKP